MSFYKIYNVLKIFTCKRLPGPINHSICATVLKPWQMKGQSFSDSFDHHICSLISTCRAFLQYDQLSKLSESNVRWNESKTKYRCETSEGNAKDLKLCFNIRSVSCYRLVWQVGSDCWARLILQLRFNLSSEEGENVMWQALVTRKWAELFILQRPSWRTQERSSCNLKLQIQTLSAPGCFELTENNCVKTIDIRGKPLNCYILSVVFGVDLYSIDFYGDSLIGLHVWQTW